MRDARPGELDPVRDEEPAATTREAGSRRALRLVGGVLALLLAGASLLAPDFVWLAPRSLGRALVEGTGAWLPTAAVVAAAGAILGAALARTGRLPRWGTELVVRSWPVWVLAGVSGTAAAAVSAAAFHGRPLHVDGVVQLFQANLLRGGAVTAPAPPLPEFFVTLNTTVAGGRWLGQFPPGFPLLLALARGPAGRVALYGSIAAALAYAVYRAGTSLYGRREGSLAAGLVAASPFALLVSASGLNHAAAAAAAAAAFWLALEAGSIPVRRGAALAAAGAGLALGALVCIRPLDGVVAAACLLPLSLRGWRGSRTARTAGLAAGLLPPLALLALYNRAVTGSPLVFGYTYVWGPAHGLGFHVSPWGEPHTLSRGLFHLHRDLWLLNGRAFGAALPLLVTAALPLALSRRPLRAPGGGGAGETALYASFLGLLAAYVPYWHHDWFLGPRYLFTAVPFFALLSARGVAMVADGLERRALARGAWVGALAAGGLWLIAAELPARVGEAFALRPDFRVDVAAEARERGIRSGVVFVKESWGSRILARLLARGLTPGEAERLYRHADHCVLELLLRGSAGRERILAAVAEDMWRLPAPRADPGRNGDPTLRLRPGVPLAPACGEEIAYDLAARYGVYTPQLAIQDPWLSGPLIVARDLRDRDRELLAALGRSPGYLYVPGRLAARGVFLALPRSAAPGPP